MIVEQPIVLAEMAGGADTSLIGSIGDLDLAAAGYVQTEWRCSGTADAYRAASPLGADGRWDLEACDREAFATRAMVRTPSDPTRSSGVVLVEWLNVSSGSDACPVWGFAGPEIVRAGHTWVGISAQWAGIVPAPALVDVGGVALQALQSIDPERYGDLEHCGDAFCFDIFTRTTAAIIATAKSQGPLGSVRADHVIAVGESQSADALTTYVNGVHPLAGVFDGFLIISRKGGSMPLGERGCGVDFTVERDEADVVIRNDLDVPVFVVQSETDVLGFIYSFPARQDDTDRIRLWEVAGTAHADISVVGEFEEFLGCDDPVNRGQFRFVICSALAHLVDWVSNGMAPPVADRLVVEGDPAGGRKTLVFATDEFGNTRGGVRTPCVDAAVQVLSGLVADDATRVCKLFGRTLAVPRQFLQARYGSRSDYLTAYTRALDVAIDGGFILLDDRDRVLHDARPGLITW